jgi:activator of HSP90 ATPase
MNDIKTIAQEILFKATPEEVYDALMDSEKHAEFTESKALISPKTGGAIAAYDGYITGTNIELKPGKRIIQSWRASNWPPEKYSTIAFTFKETPGGTMLKFVQTGVPTAFYRDTNTGWKERYWEKMKRTFGW